MRREVARAGSKRSAGVSPASICEMNAGETPALREMHRIAAPPPAHSASLLLVVRFLDRRGDGLLAHRRAALGAAGLHHGAPEVVLAQLHLGEPVELGSGGVELVAVGDDLPTDHMAGED